MTSEASPWDAALIDLFRSEVETHSEALSATLLALERTPSDTSRIDEMMRAAHSIKGAARVVGVDPAVRVAHVMEDCFVAAQQGTIALSPGDIDVLLRGVDLLGKISEATRDPHCNLTHEFSGLVQTSVAELQAVLQATSKSASDVTISIPELLDSEAAEGIRRQVLSAIDSQCGTIRFDLRATKDLDVQGLALLAAIPQHVARHSRSSLQLVAASSEMATVLRVTGLEESFGIRRGIAREAE